jgi:glycosyltransferase involved in cell wall biosynthesis
MKEVRTIDTVREAAGGSPGGPKAMVGGPACRQLRPTVVHSHGYRADVVGARAARRLGIPVVSTAQGITGGGWKNRLHQSIQWRALGRFDAVISVSRPIAAELTRRGVPGDRIHVIPNAYQPIGDRGRPGTPSLRSRVAATAAGGRILWNCEVHRSVRGPYR